MPMKFWVASTAFCLFMATVASAQCRRDQQALSVTPKYIVREVNLEHSGDLTSDELDNIEPKLLGYCFNEPGRPSEIVRDELQQRGYFRAFVHEAHVFSLGDGTLPQPVRVTIALEAGRVYHLDEIFFRDA